MNKTLLHTAVGTALALGLGLPAAQASHELLIPYVVKDANRTTIVTVIGSGKPVKDGPSIHLQYWTKDTTAANTAACQPSSTTLTFTDNDIVTFDTAGLLGYPLFGDTTNQAPLGTSISYAGPRHGYLAVASEDEFSGEAAYWLEVDLANGGAHGDVAAHFDSNTDGSTISEAMALYFNDYRPVAFWPAATASSVFTVTPLGADMQGSDNNTVVLQVFNSSDVQGAYDRNENGVDGTVPQTVRCVGRLTPAQLMPGVVANAAWAAQGGWGWLVNLGDGDTNFTEGFPADLNAMVYQVDTSSAAGAGKFLQNAYRIATDDGSRGD